MVKTKNSKIVSIRDVASQVGVSPTTVSLALQGSSRVSVEMREKIQQAARRMNYHRNSLVDTIFKGTSNTIGILVAHIFERFQGDICGHIIDLAHDSGFFSMVYNHHLEADREKDFIHKGIEKQLEGFIIFATRDQANDEDFWQLKEMGIPFVLIDKNIPGLNCNSVITDDIAGAYMMTNHLLALGHRRILHISGETSFFTARERISGFKSAMTTAGIDLRPEMIYNFTYEPEKMEVLSDGLKSHIEHFRPSAIFCGNDHIAGFTGKILADLGLKVPDDISVAGYGRVEDYIMGNVRLTTVDQHIDRISAVATEMLLRDIMAKRKGLPVNDGTFKIVESEIFEGKSCKKNKNV